MFEIGKQYNFDVYPSKILPPNYHAVTCTGIFNWELAQQYISLDSLHARVYPYLPKGTPNDPRMYQYVQFKLQDGSHIVLGLPWIQPTTIKSIEAEMIVVEIRDVTSQDVKDVINALAANGFTNVKSKVIPLG